MVRLPLVGAILLVSLSCASTQLPPMEAAPGEFVPEQDESRLWNDARELEQRIEQSGLVYRDSALQAYIGAVAQRLVDATLDSAKLAPRVYIVRNPFLNAFALPNGAIYLHTGMLARMESEAQLATLLGHELTHVTHRHAIREMRAARNKLAFTRVLTGMSVVAGAAALGQGAGSALGGLTESLGSLWILAAVNGYSRELETDADQRGLEAMVRAGYDPREAPRIFEHLEHDDDPADVKEPFFYGTHPRLQERLESYRLLLATRYAGAAAESGRTVGAAQYLDRLRTLLLDNAVLDLQLGRLRTAEAGVARYLERWPGTPRAHFLRGEIERRSSRAEQAIAAYGRAGRLDTTYADPHRELGLLYRELGRQADARAELERYLVLSPNATDAPIIRWHVRQMDRQ